MYSASTAKSYVLALVPLRLAELNFSSFSREERRVVRDLIVFLHDLQEVEYLNSFLQSALDTARDLEAFLEKIELGFQGKHKWRLWLSRLPDDTSSAVNSHLDFILHALVQWQDLVAEKNAELPRDNSHLANLAQHEDPSRFYLMVGELAPDRVDFRHPLTLAQRKAVARLSTEKLLSFFAADPIAAHRIHRPEDSSRYPGSFIVVRQGHHRLHELYRRYIMGIVDGNTLVEVVIDYPST